MRLYEKLRISEEQCSQLTAMIGSFLRTVWDGTDGKMPRGVTLCSWWLEYVQKPEWLEERLEDIEFLGQVCYLIEQQMGAAQHFECKGEMKIRRSLPLWARALIPTFTSFELKEASN